MSQDEIIVDKVNFIKRIAEKYDLVYEEHIQKNGIKDFSLYFDKENKYKILNYDTFFFRSYSVLQSLAIDFMVLGNPIIKYGEFHNIISNDLTEQYIKTLKYTYDEFIRITTFITKEQKADKKLNDIKNDF
jgi:hypothetical protein